jgi:hypothetical protein
MQLNKRLIVLACRCSTHAADSASVTIAPEAPAAAAALFGIFSGPAGGAQAPAGPAGALKAASALTCKSTAPQEAEMLVTSAAFRSALMAVFAV